MGIEAAIIGAAVVGATGSAIGASMTNSAQSKMADKANAQAQRNSDTAHQREVADLRAAGHNPGLSAGGSGAPVPSYQVPTLENPLAGLSNAMSQGITNATAYQGTKQIDPQIEKTKSETKLTEALELKAGADTISALETAGLTGANKDAVENSPFMSKFLGSKAAKSLNFTLSGAKDNIAKKLEQMIDEMGVTSASKTSKRYAKPPELNYTPIPKMERKDLSSLLMKSSAPQPPSYSDMAKGAFLK